MTFPRYPEYKDSGVEWLGEVPGHWDVTRLSYGADTIVPMRDKPPDLTGEVPWVRIEDFAGKFISTSMSGQGVNQETVQSMHLKVFPTGTVLCSCSCNMGRAAIAARPLVSNQTFIGLLPNERLLADYLYYLMQAAQDELTALGTGAIQQYLSQDDFRALRLPYPPGEEQDQVSRVLDHETGKIDALIEEQRRLIELLKEKRQAVISHGVTKGLDPTVPMKDSGVEWLGEVPAHWRVSALRWYATIQGGLAKGKKYGPDEPLVSRPYLRVANVQDGHFDLSVVHDVAVGLSELSRYELREHDVLMNEGGDSDKLGRGAVWQGDIEGCLHQNHVFAIRPNLHLSSKWLSMFTRSDAARAYFYLYSKQSTNLASISSRNVMACPIPIPPVKEQREVLDKLSVALRQIDKLIDETESAMTLLQERRAALVSAAVTGKIDVRGWAGAAEQEEPELPMVAQEQAGYSAQGGAA